MDDIDTLGDEWKALNAKLDDLRPHMQAAVRAARETGGPGTTYQQLAARAGVAVDTIRLWLNPEAQDRQYKSRRKTGEAPVPKRKERVS